MKIDEKATGLVFDIETRPHPDLAKWLQTDEKIARLEGMDVEQLQEVAMAEEIKLGNYKNLEPIRRKIADHYSSERSKAALKLYGAEICSIACRPLSGVIHDIDALHKGDPGPDEWPGHVWTITEGAGEREVIRGFFLHLQTYHSVVLMGFNIRGMKPGRRGFDIPMLRARCAAIAFAWPEWLPATVGQDRYHDSLWDVCDVLHEGSCDTWLRAMGFPMKTASGGDVATMTPDELRQYNANDVEVERLLCGAVINSTQPPSLRSLLE